jgi:inosine/xanthosine triphosphate pyrophosphatase family protein
MPTILLATGNAAKQAKLRWLISGLRDQRGQGYDPLTPRDLGLTFDPPERGGSHREVAAAKAADWANRAGVLVIASDGGAHIPALGASWNSLFTKRAAGDVPDDAARADHLLALMQGQQGTQRSVTWIEGVAVATPGAVTGAPGAVLGAWEAQGAIGRLVDAYDRAKVSGGFWFPALLVVPRFGKLLADLTPAELEQVDDGWNTLRDPVRSFLAALP